MVSAFVHGLAFGDEDGTEDAVDSDTDEVDENVEETDTDEEPAAEDAVTDPADTEQADIGQADPGAHGTCVSAVAHRDEVGGKNENHGGAVSEAARVTCWEDPAKEPTEEELDEEASTDEQASDKGHHGKSQAAHDRKRARMADRG